MEWPQIGADSSLIVGDVLLASGRSGRRRTGDRPFIPRRDNGRVLQEVFERLLAEYGPQRWWPGETAFEVIVGAILTQSAAWTNVEKALVNLKAAGVLTPEGLNALDEAEIARLIRPSGYFNAKARKLKAFVEMLHERFRGDLEALLSQPMGELRGLLLAIHGIGPETADSVVLYAAGQPSFVIDAYTRRMFTRIGLAANSDTYDGWQRLITAALPADAPTFNEYHALIVAHGKAVCRKAPRCVECVLRVMCCTGRGLVGPDGQSGMRYTATSV